MIVPSALVLLTFVNVVLTASPHHAANHEPVNKRQTVNATPAQAAAAAAQVNSAVAQIIIAIVAAAQQAAALISSISAASVARTAITSTSTASSSSATSAPVSSITSAPVNITSSATSTYSSNSYANSTSSASLSASKTSSSSASRTSAKTCPTVPAFVIASLSNPNISSNFLPTVVNAVYGNCIPVCQPLIDSSNACSTLSTGLAQAQCGCATSFLNKLALCSACLDSLSGSPTNATTTGYYMGESMGFCSQCVQATFQPSGACAPKNPPADFTPCGLYPTNSSSTCVVQPSYPLNATINSPKNLVDNTTYLANFVNAVNPSRCTSACNPFINTVSNITTSASSLTFPTAFTCALNVLKTFGDCALCQDSLTKSAVASTMWGSFYGQCSNLGYRAAAYAILPFTPCY